MSMPTKIRLNQNRSTKRSVVTDREAVDVTVGFKCTSISKEDADGVRLVELEITNGDRVYTIRKEADRVDVLLRQFESIGVLDEYTVPSKKSKK